MVRPTGRIAIQICKPGGGTPVWRSGASAAALILTISVAPEGHPVCRQRYAISYKAPEEPPDERRRIPLRGEKFRDRAHFYKQGAPPGLALHQSNGANVPDHKMFVFEQEPHYILL